MNNMLKGVKVSISVPMRLPSRDALNAELCGTVASQTSQEEIEIEALRQMREHTEWVVEQALAAGIDKDDLMFISNRSVPSVSYMLIINKRQATLVSEAFLNWHRDDLYITLKSAFGNKPQGEKA